MMPGVMSAAGAAWPEGLHAVLAHRYLSDSVPCAAFRQ
jgi:hypothetical protein